jgi:RNA polymerase sigma-70 factor (ECF subfamily)
MVETPAESGTTSTRFSAVTFPCLVSYTVRGLRGGEEGLTVQETETAERLAIEAAQNDPARFAELYEDNFERVYAYIARRVRDRDEIQDLTSEVFHQALSNLSRFEWRGVPFAAWLFRIATNAIIDHWKRAAKQTDFAGFDYPSEVSPREVEETEQRGRLFKLVDRLPEDQRRVIVLRFAEDKSIRDVAHEISRSEGAVKQLQFRALQNLRTWETGRPPPKRGKQTGDSNG